MDFLDPKKQKQLSIQLFIGYILVTIVILLAALVLIYYAYGFGVTREGEVVQKGIVFVSSQPSGADLYVSGKRAQNTNTKLNLNAGTYTLDIERNGYAKWHREVTVGGGGVYHYVYPFLFPSKLVTKNVKTYPATPSLVTESLDRRWLLALTDVQAATFDVLDLSKNQTDIKQTETFSVPATLLSTSASVPRWEFLEWSSNNRHVLLKRYFTATKGAPETFEYILVDRQRPEGSHNLFKELGVTPTELTLRDKRPDSYYLYDATTKNLSTATLDRPAPIIDIANVLAYKSHGSDTVVYATTEKAPAGTTAIKFRQGSKDFLIRTVPVSTSYMLDTARFDGDWYVVMGSQSDNKVFVYKNPAAKADGGKTSGAIFALRIEAPTHVSFSATAQYILVQTNTEARIYDIDNDKGYHYNLPLPLDAPQKKMIWMDGDRLTYVSGGKQVVFDYDNTNLHQLASTDPAFPAIFDRQYKYMYSFTAPGQPGLSVSATGLRTAGDL